MKNPFKNYNDWLLLTYFFVFIVGLGVGLLTVATIKTAIFGLALIFISLAGVAISSKGLKLTHSRDYEKKGN